MSVPEVTDLTRVARGWRRREDPGCPGPLKVCVRYGKRQCQGGLILCEVAVSQIHKKSENEKLGSIATKLEYTRHRD